MSEPVEGTATQGRELVELRRRVRELERVQLTLRESESRFRELTEHVREVFWLTDWTSRRVLYVSPRYEAVWGRSQQSLYDDPRSWSQVIHAADRERVVDAFLRDAPQGTYDVEYRILRTDGSLRWIHDRAFPIRDENGLVCRVAGLSEDVTERRAQEEHERARLVQFHERQRAILRLARHGAVVSGDFEPAVRTIAETAAGALDAARASVWLLDEAHLVLRCVAMYEREAARHSRGDVLLARDYPAYFAALESERVVDARDAQRDPRTRELRASYLAPLGIGAMLDASVRVGGRVVGVVCHEHLGGPREWNRDEVTFVGEIADQVALAWQNRARKRDAERMQLVVQELDHRVKNTLTTVLAISDRTLVGADSLESFRESFVGRISALARVHEALARHGWGNVDLRALARATLAPYEGRDAEATRITLDGPAVELPPRAVPPLSMALHELVTNAVKYGPLSVPGGTIAIEWSVEGTEDRRRLSLHWAESGGPPAREPGHRGFGTTLIEHGIAYELEGEAFLAFDTRGLRCAIEFPL